VNGLSGPFDDTWVFNGSTWAQVSTSPMPPARYDAQMAYDQGTGQVVLFGGGTSSSILDDTWSFNGAHWYEESPTSSPPATGAGTMAYDPALGDLVLVGGVDQQGLTDGTWTYGNDTWTQQSPASSPAARDYQSMDYDRAAGLMLLFGGDTASGAVEDEWLYGPPSTLTQTSRTLYEVTQGQIAEDLDEQGPNVEVNESIGGVDYVTTASSSADVEVLGGGAISASPSTPVGDYAMSGTGVDGIGRMGTWSVEVQVAAAPVVIVPGGSVLPGSTVGDSYSQQFSAEQSPGPYTWSVTAGTLPAGLTLSSAGLLSGATTAEGNYSFTIKAWDTADDYGASVATSIAVAPASLTVSPSSLPGATSGDLYATSLSLSGGVGTATFDLAAGSVLPAGLVLSSTGVLSGTPTSSGSSSFSIVATDGDGFSTTQGYSMIVEAPGASPITLSPGTLPELDLGQHLDQSLSASGGTGPYSYAVTAGALPEGFTLAFGTIYGVWNEAESGQFTVTATDAEGQSAAVTYLLAVVSGGVTVSPATLPSLVSSQNYQQAITASGGGGTGPYEFTITSGSLPQNMSLSADGSDAVYLEGGPDYFPFGEYEQVGTFTFTISAYDEYSGNTGAQTYTLTVLPAPDITVNHTAPWSCTVGVRCATQLKASGGTAPYTFALQPGEPGLPAGFTLSTSGLVMGTATPSEVSNYVYDVNLVVTDADGFTGYLQDNFYVVVPHHLKVSPSTLPDPVVGQAYDQLLSAKGGGIPYTYAVTAGALPAGLNLDTSDGDISGTPTTPGPVPKFTITATDANGYTTSASYKVAVLGAPTFTSPTTAVVQEKLAKTKITITTTGSYPAPLMLISGALPAGLSFTAGKDGTATITARPSPAPAPTP
jgi:large repetitive protein